jgi:chorismate mutase
MIMPIPRPRKKEKTTDFISRCISVLSHIDTKRPQEQIVAICYAQARKHGRRIRAKKPKTKKKRR